LRAKLRCPRRLAMTEIGGRTLRPRLPYRQTFASKMTIRPQDGWSEAVVRRSRHSFEAKIGNGRKCGEASRGTNQSRCRPSRLPYQDPTLPVIPLFLRAPNTTELSNESSHHTESHDMTTESIDSMRENFASCRFSWILVCRCMLTEGVLLLSSPQATWRPPGGFLEGFEDSNDVSFSFILSA
jgi:hypothetical protein